ncbi:MAG: hypothetical protein IPL25_19165 [Saprospiraceae bacterium]|nr:hypothetical protein [Candidatus Vicinibacter affinis]
MDEFCAGNYADRLEDYIFYYTEIGQPLDATNPYFVSFQDFVENGYSTFCVAYALYYKPYFEANSTFHQLMSLELMCNGKIPQM